MRRIAVTAIVPLLLALPAAAAEQCRDRQQVIEYLSAEYSEAPVAMGLANNGGMIEVLTSADGHSWTILVTTPDGKTCMVAAGESWQNMPLVVSKVEPEA